MESLALVSSPKMVLGCSAKPKDMVSGRYPFGLPRQFHNTRRIGLNRPTTSILAFYPPQSNHGRTPIRLSKSNGPLTILVGIRSIKGEPLTSLCGALFPFNVEELQLFLLFAVLILLIHCCYTVLEKLGREGFASITSSNSQETSSVGVNPPLIVPPPPSYFGSPLFWVGVGVGLSALFSWVRMWITCMLFGLVFVYNFSFLCICLDDLNFMAGGFKVEAFVDISPEETLQRRLEDTIKWDSTTDDELAGQVRIRV
ncbi:hypothetical protein C3L33_13196, partial [Rhododendron williamsianum]